MAGSGEGEKGIGFVLLHFLHLFFITYVLELTIVSIMNGDFFFKW
jgi:hypothetical protein